jgi:hypothetical protein
VAAHREAAALPEAAALLRAVRRAAAVVRAAAAVVRAAAAGRAAAGDGDGDGGAVVAVPAKVVAANDRSSRTALAPTTTRVTTTRPTTAARATKAARPLKVRPMRRAIVSRGAVPPARASADHPASAVDHRARETIAEEHVDPVTIGEDRLAIGVEHLDRAATFAALGRATAEGLRAIADRARETPVVGRRDLATIADRAMIAAGRREHVTIAPGRRAHVTIAAGRRDLATIAGDRGRETIGAARVGAMIGAARRDRATIAAEGSAGHPAAVRAAPKAATASSPPSRRPRTGRMRCPKG